MSIQKIRTIFKSIDSKTAWGIQLVKFGCLRGEQQYNTHTITIKSVGAIAELVNCIKNSYLGTDDKEGILSSFERLSAYDGTDSNSIIYKISTEDELIQNQYIKLMNAINSPDMAGNALEFNANAYILAGDVVGVDCERIAIKFITIQTPYRVMRHAFFSDHDLFKKVSDGKLLVLSPVVDIAVIGKDIYTFNMVKAERFFELQRAYKIAAVEKIENILRAGIVSDSTNFSQFALAGFNPKRLKAYSESNLEKLRDDQNFRRKVSEMFNISMTDLCAIDTSDKGNVDALVKFLCNKAMVHPVDGNPREVGSSWVWKN